METELESPRVMGRKGKNQGPGGPGPGRRSRPGDRAACQWKAAGGGARPRRWRRPGPGPSGMVRDRW
jgi:hypothetical protein